MSGCGAITATIDCGKLTIRQINERIREVAAKGEPVVTLRHPQARHNLAVGILRPVKIIIEGSAGYYCSGMVDGPTVEVKGNAGWGLAEGMMQGAVVVEGHAGNGAAASIRGGSVTVHGDAGARAGIAMKGGVLAIQGSAGIMAGFMMQKGTLIICGDAGPGVADSMYAGTVFVGGKIADLGADTEVSSPSAQDAAFLKETLARLGFRPPSSFQKIVSARKLWNFSSHELAIWKQAL